MSEKRKSDHIELARASQYLPGKGGGEEIWRKNLHYEPLFGHHLPLQNGKEDFSSLRTQFMGFSLGAPFWVSSMTGGAELGGVINRRLAENCGRFQIPFALGSCRSLLDSSERLDDFAVKKYMNGQPLFANIGLAQIETLLHENTLSKLYRVIREIEANGLIIHINPIQEWLQMEGDRWYRPALMILQDFLAQAPKDLAVVVKEVGQGMGPKSLRALMQLPLAAIEFASLGGTNFNLLEQMRRAQGTESHTQDFGVGLNLGDQNWMGVGHSALEMVGWVKQLLGSGEKFKCTNFIISGGIRSLFDGQALVKELACPALIGQAYPYLRAALAGEKECEQFFLGQMRELFMVSSFLH